MHLGEALIQVYTNSFSSGPQLPRTGSWAVVGWISPGLPLGKDEQIMCGEIDTHHGHEPP